VAAITKHAKQLVRPYLQSPNFLRPMRLFSFLLAVILINGCDNVLSDDGKAKAEMLVANQMKDPDSAVFRYMQQSKTRPSHWCGQVNARNAYGAMAGYQLFLVDIDTGEVMMGETILYKPEADGFCK